LGNNKHELHIIWNEQYMIINKNARFILLASDFLPVGGDEDDDGTGRDIFPLPHDQRQLESASQRFSVWSVSP